MPKSSPKDPSHLSVLLFQLHSTIPTLVAGRFWDSHAWQTRLAESACLLLPMQPRADVLDWVEDAFLSSGASRKFVNLFIEIGINLFAPGCVCLCLRSHPSFRFSVSPTRYQNSRWPYEKMRRPGPLPNRMSFLMGFF